MNLLRSVGLIGVLAVVSPVQAQNVGRDRIQTRFELGGSPLVAQPVGPFADLVDEGFGLDLHGLVRLDDDGILGLRLDLGFINYGNESKDVCFSNTVGCRVMLDLNTSN